MITPRQQCASEHPTTAVTGTLHPPVGPRDHAQGPERALVTLVEYGDYQCPYCAKAYPIIKELQARLGDRLRVVFRNFPLTQVHPEALHAAEAAESVGAQLGNDGFWHMHDAIYEHQRSSRNALSDAYLAQYATSIGADAARVTADLEQNTFRERIRADFSGGVRGGVNGTPTFFINGVRYDGDWTDMEAFARVLEESAQVVRGCELKAEEAALAAKAD